MKLIKNWRWRKCSDVDREYALFELLEDNIPLLDVGFTNGGRLVVSFNSKIAGTVVDWDQFREVVEEGVKLAKQDR